MSSLKLTLQRQHGPSVDVAVTAPAGVTVGSLAAALAERDPGGPAASTAGGAQIGPVTLALHTEGNARVLDPNQAVSDVGLGSGVTVSLRAASAYGGDMGLAAKAGQLMVVAGPDKGKTFALHPGSNLIGRDPSCTIRLTDTLVSKLHATLHIGANVEIKDANSTNGVEFGGGLVSRAVLRPGDQVRLGDTVVSVMATAQATTAHTGSHQHGEQHFNRSPRLDPVYEGIELEAPAAPKKQAKRRFPWIQMFTPMLMGAGMYLISGSKFALIFMILGPVIAGVMYLDDRVNRRKQYKLDLAEFRISLESLEQQLRKAVGEEHLGRCASHPSVGEMVGGAHQYGPLLWTRRPEHATFLDLRLGLGTLPSRNTVKLPSRNEIPQDLWDEMLNTIDPYSTVDVVPVVGELTKTGAIGVAGPDQGARRVARGLIAQLVTLHSPAELVLTAIMSRSNAQQWEWLKWLPHTSSTPMSTHTPLKCDHLTIGGAAASTLVSELDDLIARRSGEKGAPNLPRVVVLVTDDTDVDRGRLVDIAERGPANGVYLIWIAAAVVRLPAVCRTFIEASGEGINGEVGYVKTGKRIEKVRLEPLSGAQADQLALRMSPVIDAGARTADESDLPRSASFVSLARAAVDRDPQAIVDKWAEAQSGLRAMIGALGADEALHLDLVTHGPHALVGGTTGAGKSELLQSWLLGMATARDPRRVNFLLVDYKGGSAFGVISKLPHSVGMVTDLNPHLVRRALTSLRAELTRRERIVEQYHAKDLADLERNHLDKAPARLVIVVDEFAALKKEIPEFVDGMVDIAQRGRSLGLHLILATQRPAGVISDQLRANTNLRIALRMADAGDSNDVIGMPMAASFDLDIPGRAAARTGPGRVTMFQAAYAGGWTRPGAAGAQVQIRPMPFGLGESWKSSYVAPEQGDTDIIRIVETIRRANDGLRLPAPPKPWLPELPTQFPLTDKPVASGPGIMFGKLDVPASQAQPPAVFDPDVTGNLLTYGAGGSGKSTLLRTIAVAGIRGDSGPCHVYGIDFGNRGLDMLDELPQVASPIVRGEDQERLMRLLDRLQRTVQERAAQFNGVQASTITEYWRRTSTVDPWRTPRILVLLDGAGAFYSQYPPGMSGLYEKLVNLASLGRPVGIHIVMTADRPNSVPGSLAATAQSRLVMRLASDGDYNLLGIRSADALASDAPAGRALFDRNEVQVAVLGGSDIDAERQLIEHLAARTAGAPRPQDVSIMPTSIQLSALAARGDKPIVGVDYESLEAVSFEPGSFFIVTGLAGSGRTTALRTMCASLQRSRPQMPMHLFARIGGELASSVPWQSSATEVEKVKDLAKSLTEELVGAPPSMVMVDSFPEFADNREVAPILENLFKVCRDNGHFVVVEGESPRMVKSDSLYQLVKSRRCGIALQQAPALQFPTIFGFEQAKMPKMSSPPPGRGLLITNGVPKIVQIAVPS